MKKIIVISLVLLGVLYTCNSFAQEVTLEFGKIDASDFEIQAPEDDPDAEAIILFDIGKTRFYSTGKGLDIKFTRLTRILILDESGLDWAKVEIPLYIGDNYYEQERVKRLRAHSYNITDGRIFLSKLDAESVFTEKINENWNQQKFAMPAVKVGTIIEYEYDIHSPFVFNLPDWEFQNRIPTIYSSYSVGITPFYEYTFLLQGDKKLDSYNYVDEHTNKTLYTTTYQDRVHNFVMKDIPAFKDESYITSVEDYIMKIDFQLSKIRRVGGETTDYLTTWKAMNERLIKHENFGMYINKSERLAKKILAENLSIEGLDENNKCKQIVEYVKNNYSWNGKYRKYTEKSPKEFLKETDGSNAEVNLFLIGMLRAAGINAKPILISTRSHGRIRVDYPYAHLFNYVIVLAEVNSSLILTDGTEPLLSYARIPSRCINHEGLIIDKEGESWVNLTNSVAFPSVAHRNLNLKIDTDELMIKGEFLDQSNEYLALKNKKAYIKNAEAFIEALQNKGFENVDDVLVMNLEAPGKPFVISYRAEYPLEYFEDKIIVAPFLNLPISENKLKQPTRLYPVDMNYKKNWVYKSIINIPEGYQILSVPEDFLMDNSLMKIELKSIQTGKHVSITGVIEYKKAVYPSKDYKRLKSYINIVIKRFNDKVVFIEKEIEDENESVSAEGT
jgi:hypothetical protein